MNTLLNFFGIKRESFSGYEDAGRNPGIIAVAGLFIIFLFIFGIIYNYGAAKLSYTYNMSINNSNSALLWSVLCFFFSGFYYPYYAIMLNPTTANMMAGGKKR